MGLLVKNQGESHGAIVNEAGWRGAMLAETQAALAEARRTNQLLEALLAELTQQRQRP